MEYERQLIEKKREEKKRTVSSGTNFKFDFENDTALDFINPPVSLSQH